MTAAQGLGHGVDSLCMLEENICQQKIEGMGKTNDKELGKAVITMQCVVGTSQIRVPVQAQRLLPDQSSVSEQLMQVYFARHRVPLRDLK